MRPCFKKVKIKILSYNWWATCSLNTHMTMCDFLGSSLVTGLYEPETPQSQELACRPRMNTKVTTWFILRTLKLLWWQWPDIQTQNTPSGINDNPVLMTIYIRMCQGYITRPCFKRENLEDNRYLLPCLMNSNEIFLTQLSAFMWIRWGNVTNPLLAKSNNRWKEA